MSQLLNTLSAPFVKARSVNATNTSFPSLIPTAAEPSGDAGTATGSSVIELSNKSLASGKIENAALIVPFGAGSDTNTFSMRVIGWKVVGRGSESVWIPVTLAEFSCALSTPVGVAGGAVVATDRFCDTITVVTGNSGVSVDVVSPADNTIGSILIDLKGFQKLELAFDMTGATNGNALVTLL